MGMLLRHRPSPDNMTTQESINRVPKVGEIPEKTGAVKDEKPRTVKRGRPTAKK